MTLLIFGNILWIIAHTFKRLLPNFRNSLGNAGKGVVAFLIIISLVLMILGYRSAEYIGVWTPPQFFLHINNLMMVAAVFVFAIGHTKGRLRGRLRHPMLTSVKIWALAHLLVNGDLASIVAKTVKEGDVKGIECYSFESETEEDKLKIFLNDFIQKDDIVLLKGSRGMRMERFI